MAEARVANGALEKDLGLRMASFIIRPFECLLPTSGSLRSHQSTRVSERAWHGVLASMYVDPHVCTKAFTHIAPFRAVC